MNNDLAALNNYLFEQIERLNDDELDNEALEKEVKRAETITKIARTVIDNGSLALQVKKHLDEYGAGERCEIPVLGISSEKK